MNKVENPISYTTTPRHISADYFDKKLQRNELFLLLWLRALGDPYGFATVNTITLRDDIFPNLEVNTVVKLLRSLREKKYLYFQNHQGHRGSFRIELDEWLTKDKKVKRITNRYSDNNEINESLTINQPIQESHPEPSHKLVNENQKLIEAKKQLIKGFSMNQQSSKITSPYNEHDNEKEKENNDTLGKSFKGTLVRDFQPRNNEEYQCKEIASELGEQFINPILNVLRISGLRTIERAFGLYKEDRERGKKIDNSPAYFQGIIKKLQQNQ